MPKALTILPSDPSFPDYLDFEILRIEGRKHIAELSGEIWTDHNIHDPGITIMEILVYAILDLGYRNQLPTEELLAINPQSGQQEDNFFTAAEILTNNPLTVNDYRKLLLDQEGIRNAWLEPTDEAEVLLVVDCENSKLRFQKDDTPLEGQQPLRLNGLYKVYLELEREYQTAQKKRTLIDKVEALLHAHRNLSEDFVCVEVLGDEEIAVCAEIELSPGAEADETMLKILEIIDNFLSPSITFYTLRQLLDKGKTTDEIFAGRPLMTVIEMPDQTDSEKCATPSFRSDSHGFIDTEELEALERIREIHVSDLYREILKIPEVRAINKLLLRSYIDGKQGSGTEPWCLKIRKDRRPVLAADRADFTFFKDVLPFRPNLRAVVEQFKKRLGNIEKSKLNTYELDLPIPLGRFRNDLQDYRSIQHDFPQVYGIGEGQLSADAPKLRKAQALQLKAYLLFFDQLFANYLAQLGHVRELFSMSPEDSRPPDNRRSYFVQQLQGIPKIRELIRFYDETEIEENCEKAIAELLPSKQLCADENQEAKLPDSPALRDLLIRESLRAFQNDQVRFEIWSEGNKYRFIGFNTFNQAFLKGKALFDTETDALDKTKTLQFLAVFKSAYKKVNCPDEKEYSFEIICNPMNYLDYLNQISEDKNAYSLRRDTFLNHLLARFAEHFTDYVLLMFALNGQRHDPERTLRDKSNFLHNYPQISRNRGQAFNFRLPTEVWNTANISGFERRVTAMMGISNAKRRNISNFKIVKQTDIYYYRIFIDGVVVFTSRYAYPSVVEAQAAMGGIFALSKSADNYQCIDCELESVFTFKIVGGPNNEAIHPGIYPSAAVRKRTIEKLLSTVVVNFSVTNTSEVKTQHEAEGEIFVKVPRCQAQVNSTAYTLRVLNEDNIYAKHPQTFPVDLDYESRKTQLLNKRHSLEEQYSILCFGTHTTYVKVGGFYHFQLVDKRRGAVLWRSTEAYQSATEAAESFKTSFYQVLDLAREEINYEVLQIEGKDVVFLKMEEVRLAVIPTEELEGVLTRQAILARVEHALKYPVTLENGQYKFRLISFNNNNSLSIDWISVPAYGRPIAAWLGFINFLDLLTQEPNWLRTIDGDNQELGIAIGEVLLEGEHYYSTAQEAWDGTKDLLQEFHEDYALNHYIDYWEDCSCGFRIVNRDFRLARHPHYYQTPGERAVVMSCLQQNAANSNTYWEITQCHLEAASIITEDGHTCYYFFILDSAGNKLWRSYRAYHTEEYAKKAYDELHIPIMNQARMADHYRLKKTQVGKCKVLLVDTTDEPIAVIPIDFAPDANNIRLTEISKRISLGRRFPIVKTAAGFHFDIYDTKFDRTYLLANAPNVICGNVNDNYCLSPGPSTQLPPYPNDCGEEEQCYLVQYANLLVSGGVVLVGVQCFNSIEEITCFMKWLESQKHLFKQFSSYQASQEEACGSFSIEWVNPAGILAYHPRRYTLVEDCRESIDRTLNVVNLEGLHLVEHILLRPCIRPAERFVLKIISARGKHLLYSVTDYATPEEAANLIPSFVDQVVTAAGQIIGQLNDLDENDWQSKLQLTNTKGKNLAVGCWTPTDFNDYKSTINYLCLLKTAQVEVCTLEEKSCGGALPAICLDTANCSSQSLVDSVEKCGVEIIKSESHFDNYLAGSDPFSFWVTIVMPFWPKRFQNTNFRAFFENTIRRELPAYIAARIRWINPRDMNTFETLYREWLLLKSKLAQYRRVKAPEVQADSCLDPQLADQPIDNSEFESLKNELNRTQTILLNLLLELENEYPLAHLSDGQGNSSETIIQLDQLKLG